MRKETGRKETGLEEILQGKILSLSKLIIS